MTSSLSNLVNKILPKEFIKLNANKDTTIKNAKRAELNTKIVSYVLNTQILNMI